MTTITIDRSVVEQALEASYLAGFNASGEGYNAEYPFEGANPVDDRHWSARRDEYIREALAEQPSNQLDDINVVDIQAEQRSDSEHMEPVAWLFTNLHSGDFDFCYQEDEHDDDREMWHRQPLYTTPQPRREVELTDEEIDALPWGPSYDNPMTLTEGLREFARAVIKAYKSKQGEQI